MRGTVFRLFTVVSYVNMVHFFRTGHHSGRRPYKIRKPRMQPISFRSTSKRVKRRRVVANDDNGSALSPSRNAHSFGNQPAHEDDEGIKVEDDDEDGDVADLPVCRRIVQGVVQEAEKKTPAKGEAVKEDELQPLPQLESNCRSQIERLMNRRKANPLSDEPDADDGAKFRKQLASCADEVDDDTYATVPVEKFGARMLAAMGWKPDKRGDGDDGDDAVEKQRVQRPAGLGLGAKLIDTGSPAPPTHRRCLNERRDGANGTTGASAMRSPPADGDANGGRRNEELN